MNKERMKFAVTGHRPNKLGGYGKEAHDKLIAVAIEILTKCKPTTVITGMALGWDQAVAQACVELHIRFHAYIPGVWQHSTWPAESQEHYRWLICQEACSLVKDTDPEPSIGYQPYKLQVRNEAMIDNCDILIALWDGTAGGTANCIRYAMNRKLTVVNVYNSWVNLQSS